VRLGARGGAELTSMRGGTRICVVGIAAIGADGTGADGRDMGGGGASGNPPIRGWTPPINT
jgi:hypothetical protein